jgi:hypothetical protein
MANQYATSAEAIARNPSLANVDLIELDAALEAASRWIDGYCGRKFWLDPVDTPTIRVFTARDPYVLDLGEHEIGSLTGVVVKTDSGAGTYATTVTASAYVLEPVNAPYATAGARPYTSIRGISTAWPLTYSNWARQDLVQVTARYGWPSIPPAVRDVCLALTTVEVENPTGVRSEAIDGYSVSYSRELLGGDNQATGVIRAKLAPYRRAWAA